MFKLRLSQSLQHIPSWPNILSPGWGFVHIVRKLANRYLYNTGAHSKFYIKQTNERNRLWKLPCTPFYRFCTSTLRSSKLLNSSGFVTAVFYTFLISFSIIKLYIIYLKDRGNYELCTKFVNKINSSFNTNVCIGFVCFS